MKKFLWNVFGKIDVKTFFSERRRVEGRLSARWWIGEWPLEWTEKYICISANITRLRLVWFQIFPCALKKFPCALSQISNHTSPQGDVCTRTLYNSHFQLPFSFSWIRRTTRIGILGHRQTLTLTSMTFLQLGETKVHKCWPYLGKPSILKKKDFFCEITS